MNFGFASPTEVHLEGSPEQIRRLSDELTYEDQKIVEEIRRLKKNPWFVKKYGEEEWRSQLERLEAQRVVKLVDDKRSTTLAGFYGRLQRASHCLTKALQPPESFPWAYSKKPPDLRYYQQQAVDALIAARHGAISLPTGAGKSLVIMTLVRKLGLRAVIMAPGESIARQLFDDLRLHFGVAKVGLYGDGRKDTKQDIIVGIAASLVRVEAGTPAWEALGKRDVFVADESHLVAASTFKKVCLGLMGRALYRFFLSATQFRNDGSDLLLEGLTGPVVYDKSLYDLVSEGYLAKPVHVCVTVDAESDYVGPYPQMVQHHFYQNQRLHTVAARLACRLHHLTKLPSLILVDHVEQFKLLYPHLNFDYGFAHGPLNESNRDGVPQAFQKADNKALVQEFNAGRLPILVGTSSVSTGTDFRPTGAVIYLQAGESEIKVRQAMGRGTRLVEGKKQFYFVDFGINIQGLQTYKNPLWRHFKTRCSYYRNPNYVTAAQVLG